MAFLSLVILIDIITTSSRLFKQLALFGLEFLFGNDSLIFQFFIFFSASILSASERVTCGASWLVDTISSSF